MIRSGIAAFALGVMTLPAVAAAQTQPPATAQPLSRVIATIEANVADLAYIEDVSWDNDGYWEVEYRTTDGREVEIRVDPVTAQTR